MSSRREYLTEGRGTINHGEAVIEWVDRILTWNSQQQVDSDKYRRTRADRP